MNRLNRIDYLDVLRALIILLVIVMHTALAYLNPPYKDWVHARQSSGLFAIICFFAESGVLMPILFFISGYFTLPSLSKHGPAEFMKNKLVRLGIPFILGVFVLSPSLWAMSYYSDGGSLPLAQVVSLWFSRGYLGQFHFWYLGMLLLYFVLVYVAARRLPGLLKLGSGQPRRPSVRFFAVLIATSAAFCFVSNLTSNYTDWAILGLLQFQPVKLPLYNIYFCLGIYAWNNGWLREGYRPHLWPWAAIYAAAFACTAVVGIATSVNPASLGAKLLINTSSSVEVLAALLTCLALFQKLHSAEHPWLQKLSGMSFNAYIVHPNVVFAVLILTRDAALPLPLTYGLQAVLAVSLSWGLSYLLRRLPAVTKVLSHPRPQVIEEKP